MNSRTHYFSTTYPNVYPIDRPVVITVRGSLSIAKIVKEINKLMDEDSRSLKWYEFVLSINSFIHDTSWIWKEHLVPTIACMCSDLCVLLFVVKMRERVCHETRTGR